MQINITITRTTKETTDSINISETCYVNVKGNLIDSTISREDKLTTNVINAKKACDLIKASSVSHSYDDPNTRYFAINSIFRARVSTDATVHRANYLIIESDSWGAIEILIDDLPCVYTVEGFKVMIFKELFNVALTEKVEDEF